MAADGSVGADLEVGPAEFVLDLFVALLDPVPQPVDPHDLGEVGGQVGRVGDARGVGSGQTGGQIPGCLRRQGGRVGGGHDQADVPVRAPPAEPGFSGPPGGSVPVAEGALDACPVPGVVGVGPGQS